MKLTAIYPGSFDPITFGHIDLIERLRPLYDQFHVVIAQSSRKSYLFTVDQRKELAKKCLNHIDDIDVTTHDGLIVDYAKRVGAKVLLRGVRAVADFEYESAIANTNKKLAPEIETMVVFTRPEYAYISSRMVKEVAEFSGNLKNLADLVPAEVAQALVHRYKGKNHVS